jgi:hypothetical protein
MARRSESTTTSGTKTVRCAIYTRKSADEVLEKDFNSLDAQREAAEASTQPKVFLGGLRAPCDNWPSTDARWSSSQDCEQMAGADDRFLRVFS